MAGSTSTTFLLSAANASWGRRERTCVDFSGVSAASLDGKYFTVNAKSAVDGSDVEYYVWFNLDGGSVDPAPAGKTGIEVAVTTGDSESVMALALSAAVEADALFRGKVSASGSSVAVIDSAFVGAVDAAADVDSALAFERNVEGVGGSLGKTSGGVEVSMETISSQITSDQTGGIVLDEFTTGQSIEVTMSLLEMTPARWKTIVGSVTGDAHTPSGGSEVVGFGDSRLYSSLFDLGGELVLHPSRFADSNRSYDITLFKSAPKPASINFSGEEAQTMEVTFTALLDSEVVSAVNLMAFGDSSQDLRA